MAGKRISIFLVLYLSVIFTYGQKFRYFYLVPPSNIKIDEVIVKYNLKTKDKDSLILYNSLNATSLLAKGKKYKMPIRIYPYTGSNIRTSLGIENYNTALAIQNYNTYLDKNGLKINSSGKEKEIWAPISFLDIGDQKFVPYTITMPIFGKENAKVEITDNKLKDELFYLISGHGGPDPGANCKKEGKLLCEDEYAYDLVLRLGRNLISHGAKVYFIVVDKNDGIREFKYLKPDHDETLYGGESIPLNQVKRLKQRTDLINKLYKTYEGKYNQKLLEIHVDSRNIDKKIDLFFYHFPGSETGKKTAEKMLEKVKEKYNTHQKDRGYTGVVEERNLYSLRETLPLCIYVEIGNITNEFDQRRILIPNNRQALANWLTEGLMK